MGVPRFYRWLSERYPLINQAVDESSLLPEFDNLYLDMNGIIHNATHGNEGVSKKLTEKDVILAMMSYIDQMVKIIKPTKLLYMAIDGVAPRAKMNQQRSRRFRAARDLRIARLEAASRGEEVDDDDVFDSNCITPGTEFMSTISTFLVFFIRRKMKEDPLWQRIAVVFSGHEVPGEGEHKIIQYIRAEKMLPSYSPNTRHAMAGLDADLIMLSLATHEPHFCLLREQVDFNANRANKYGTKTKTRASQAVKWQLMHIGILREYLEMDMKPLADTVEGTSFVFDRERVVDDFVLLAALCGNDFMPHLPSLDIAEGAMDMLLKFYRENLVHWGGYLNQGGLINWPRLERLLTMMGEMEAHIFSERALESARMAQKAKSDARRQRAEQSYGNNGDNSDVGPIPDDGVDADERDISDSARAAAEADVLAGIAKRLARERKGGQALKGEGVVSDDSGLSGEEDSDAIDADDVEIEPFVLDEDDFKGRYYLDKFGITYERGSAQDDLVLERIVQSYVEALQWVLLYYYRGRPSWGWFYPFHFAPMTSDLCDLTRFKISFRLGQPFKPFQQLLGCLPAASANFLPAPYRFLMTDSSSPIIEFFPTVDQIKVDMNGKRNPWEGVTLIPFIKERNMMEALERHCPDSSLSQQELRRNSFGLEYIFTFDPTCSETVPSPNSVLFTDITNCMSRQKVFTTICPPVLTVSSASIVEDADATIDVLTGFPGPAHLYSMKPLPGCVIPAPGFPTLHALRFISALLPVRINIFGSPSRKDSLVLQLFGESSWSADIPYLKNVEQLDMMTMWKQNNVGSRVTARSFAPSVLGKVIQCNWPHLRTAQVVAASDGFEEIAWDINSPSGIGRPRFLSPDEQIDWSKAISAEKLALSSGGRGLKPAGIQLGQIELILTIRLLEGMRRNPVDGSLSRIFAAPGSDGEIRVTPQLCLFSHPVADTRFNEHGPLSAPDRFRSNTKVVLLSGSGRGATATVVSAADVKEVGGCVLEVDAVIPAPEPPFGSNIRDQIFDIYYDSRRAAQALKLSDRAFGKVTGSIIVRGGTGPKASLFDMGLNLKVQQNLYLPGYARRVIVSAAKGVSAWSSGAKASTAVAASSPKFNQGREGNIQWEFTERAVHLVAAYMREFPKVFELLDASPDAPFYSLRDVPGGAEAVLRVMTWLQQLDSYKRPLVPLTSEILSPRAIQAIEVASARWLQVSAQRTSTTRLTNVLSKDVFKAEEQAYSVGGVGDGETSNVAGTNVDGASAVPVLGDRIVNLSFRQAPLGARGTIVGIHNHSGYVEVVFDNEFIGGTTLGGQCGNGKGALLPWSAVLCLSRLPGQGAPEVKERGSSNGALPIVDSGRTGETRRDELPGGKRGKVEGVVVATSAASVGVGKNGDLKKMDMNKASGSAKTKSSTQAQSEAAVKSLESAVAAIGLTVVSAPPSGGGGGGGGGGGRGGGGEGRGGGRGGGGGGEGGGNSNQSGRAGPVAHAAGPAPQGGFKNAATASTSGTSSGAKTVPLASQTVAAKISTPSSQSVKFPTTPSLTTLGPNSTTSVQNSVPSVSVTSTSTISATSGSNPPAAGQVDMAAYWARLLAPEAPLNTTSTPVSVAPPTPPTAPVPVVAQEVKATIGGGGGGGPLKATVIPAPAGSGKDNQGNQGAKVTGGDGGGVTGGGGGSGGGGGGGGGTKWLRPSQLLKAKK